MKPQSRFTPDEGFTIDIGQIVYCCTRSTAAILGKSQNKVVRCTSSGFSAVPIYAHIEGNIEIGIIRPHLCGKELCCNRVQLYGVCGLLHIHRCTKAVKDRRPAGRLN